MVLGSQFQLTLLEPGGWIRSSQDREVPSNFNSSAKVQLFCSKHCINLLVTQIDFSCLNV